MADVHDQGGRPRATAPARLLLNLSLAASAAPQAEWSHHCSACGKCCNSAPQLSVPELFHHQQRFFGCLTVRRVSGANAGLASAEVALATQALGFGEPCPALSGDGGCAIHEDRKPATCRVVPFDAWLPDDVQHLVLSQRATEAHFLGSDCLTPGTRASFPVVTRRLSVVDTGARAALAERRRDLAEEQRFWGRAVLELLRAELFAPSSRLAQLPAGGFLTLPLVPVLLVLASVSERCRERCIAFLDAQALLCERPPLHPERALFARSNARLRAALAAAPPPARDLPNAERAALEQWLGLN